MVICSNRLCGGLVLVALCACTAYDPELLPDAPDGPAPDARGQQALTGGEPRGARPTTNGDGGNGSAAAPDQPDVTTVCGDGIVAGSEKCDTGLAEGTAGACPESCPPLGPCVKRALNGTGCQSECIVIPESCTDDDECCPGNCTADNDNDCSVSCGDGEVQQDRGETCEPDSGDAPCPTDCDDGDPCTTDMLTGSAANCNASCTHAPAEATGGDGCCPDGANANTDGDCEPVCGNGVREGGEECDGGEGCDDQCTVMATTDQERCVDTFASDECDRCACLNCTQEFLSCFDSGDAALDGACTGIVACARANDCVGPACYCGTANALTCITAPNGSCIDEIQAAAGTTDAIVIESQRLDPNTAVGRSDLLGTCSVMQCPDVCP